uniref:Mucolipin TRP cation channel 1 n=1 Tax=Sphenodon punctatus TaxID=8508 RepID=A0A8D0G470_SPHPU
SQPSLNPQGPLSAGCVSALCPLQLILFGLSNQMVVTFKEENTITFKHLFLKDYADGSEDTYAVYTQADLYDHMFYAVEKYLAIPNEPIGRYAYVRGERGSNQSALLLCQYYYRKGRIDPANDTFNIDPEIITDCLGVDPPEKMPRSLDFDEVQLLLPESDRSYKNFTLKFHKLINVTLQFKLKAINIQTIINNEIPDCYTFTILITFDNKAHSGRVTIHLDNKADIQECKDPSVYGRGTERWEHKAASLSLKGLWALRIGGGGGLPLSQKTSTRLWGHSLLTHNAPPIGITCWEPQLRDLIGRILLAALGEALGQASRRFTSWVPGLGLPVRPVSLLGAFPDASSSVPALSAPSPGRAGTPTSPAPRRARGLTLLPVSCQFRSLSMVSECLFSLINGDDMFVTFAEMQQNSYLVWLFSQLYLYTFISLFIYMVLSLFIALITGSYETIKVGGSGRSHGLHAYIAECKDSPRSGKFRQESSSACSVFCCCERAPLQENVLVVN